MFFKNIENKNIEIDYILSILVFLQKLKIINLQVMKEALKRKNMGIANMLLITVFFAKLSDKKKI